MTDTEEAALITAGASGASGVGALFKLRQKHRDHIEKTLDRLFPDADPKRREIERKNLHRKHRWWHRRKP